MYIRSMPLLNRSSAAKTGNSGAAGLISWLVCPSVIGSGVPVQEPGAICQLRAGPGQTEPRLGAARIGLCRRTVAPAGRLEELHIELRLPQRKPRLDIPWMVGQNFSECVPCSLEVTQMVECDPSQAK